MSRVEAKKTNIFIQGIVSAIGHLGLFYVAVGLGRLYRIERTLKLDEWRLYVAFLWGVSIALWIVFLGLVHVAGIEVSRRLCNASYAMWVITISHMMITIGLSTELLPTRLCSTSSSLILDAINMNQLPIFLLANVATGIVNLSMDTIHASNAKAFLVLNLYLIFLTVTAVFLYKYKIKIKFW